MIKIFLSPVLLCVRAKVAGTPRGGAVNDIWVVRWPGGVLREHSVGAEGCFDLVHLTLHRLAGAPLSQVHIHLVRYAN